MIYINYNGVKDIPEKVKTGTGGTYMEGNTIELLSEITTLVRSLAKEMGKTAPELLEDMLMVAKKAQPAVEALEQLKASLKEGENE